MVSLRTISVLALMVVASEAYHVLLVYTMPGKSLSLHGEAFVQHLLKAGHEVTYVTPFPMKNKPKENFHEVDASEGLSHIFAVGDLFNISYLLDNKQIINDREELMLYGVEVSRRTLENPNVQKLLNDKTQKFDVVIGEYFITELTAGLAAYYECPMIWSYSMGVDSFSLKLVHEPYAIYDNIFKPLFASKGKPLPAYDDIRYNASLLFINTHQAVGRLAAIPQSAKLIGGHHIDGHFEPLPKGLQEIMDKSTNGVVYFSMGSIWRSASMPDSLRNNLLAMFGSLKQTVIWKFEEDIPNLPKNVHTLKWAPQHAILGHPNCLVFISHGGLGSSTEAIHFGVPTIGVPIFFDQFLNINRAISNGYALNVELSHNLHKDLKVAIETIASNPRFTRKAKELSEIYHDRPVKPAVEIPHWVRHVVRTRGAPHLRSPALMVPWYQKSYLDLVTYVTPFPMKNKPKNNFHEVDVSEGVDKLFAEICNITFLLENTHFESDEEEIMHLGVEVAEMTLTNPNMLKLLNDKTQKFDVVVGDYLASELVAGIAYYYECPMIWSYSMGVDSAILKLVHEPTNPSYIPDYISLNIPPMSFTQRVGELWTLIRNTWVKRHSVMPRELAFYKKFYKPLLAMKGKPLPAYEDVMYNASLVLVNSHQAAGGLAAIPQSVKLIGGHHINGPVAPLPDDLKEIMDSSTNGVVYFSMGSIWKSASMPITLRDNLVRMFGSLKQTVLWKYEEEIPNLPKNIHTLKWAPQHAILAHENCMLFITHGGLGSSTEALHFGVPIVGVPISFDQFLNINRAVSKGYALSVKLSYNLHNDLKVAIDTIATGPSFKSNAKALSEIYHDRPVKPAVEIPHWVRHVVRTRGAPHLRSPALMVPWYQKTYLDLVTLFETNSLERYNNSNKSGGQIQMYSLGNVNSK
ncbi:unnamed protein product [Plutella xylostella]|uniref:(diamondback moth) hypothetical protein n=1 Tax=Plutella xylostella TaxID=51655 RepID=A0A8S4FYS3_PLUXY|nr:unnamed protein product [Plutella xylostella]